jgi:hypothetical protein
MTTNTLLIGATDLTRYDRTIDLESYGAFLASIAKRGDDLILPGMPGRVFGGRVSDGRDVSLLLELTGNTAANTWASTHAQMVTDFHTNLATLKTLLAVGTQTTLSVNATTTTAVCTSAVPAFRAEFWADVTISWTLLEGTV